MRQSSSLVTSFWPVCSSPGKWTYICQTSSNQSALLSALSSRVKRQPLDSQYQFQPLAYLAFDAPNIIRLSCIVILPFYALVTLSSAVIQGRISTSTRLQLGFCLVLIFSQQDNPILSVAEEHVARPIAYKDSGFAFTRRRSLQHPCTLYPRCFI